MKKTKQKSKKKVVKQHVKKIIKKTVSPRAPQGHSKILPLGDRVLIRPFTKDELLQKNSFGIILPDSGSKEKTEQGLVLGIGRGVSSISVEDVVCFSKYGYEDIHVDGEELYLIKEENVLAILKN